VTWSSAPALSVGVEEELFLVDREALELVSAIECVAPDGDPRVKPELFACIAEVTTPACRDADEALAELRGLREKVAERIGIVAVGTHPLAIAERQDVAPVKRYARLAAGFGEVVFTQLVCGLHVHIALQDAETALRAFEGVVPWLPTLLGLSANSPFVEGKTTGLLSTRAERLLLMPTGGTPPLLPDWKAWERATAGDESRRHWDAWPRPEHGTLEVRVMDQQTDVRRSAGLAEIVQELVRAVLDTDVAPYDRALYAERRARAARSAADPVEVDALAALIEPGELAVHVLEGRPEAERQLELGPEAALRELAVASLP
jgi:glutamate---cysteine ligase / carboxylate-amine ligase